MASDFVVNKSIDTLGKVYSDLGRLKDLKAERPQTIIGVLGCMAQSRGQELIDKLPDVDLVLGTQKFHRAAEYLDEILAGRRDKIVLAMYKAQPIAKRGPTKHGRQRSPKRPGSLAMPSWRARKQISMRNA